MQGITDRIIRHERVLDIRVDNLVNGGIDMDEWHIINEGNHLVFMGIIPAFEFFKVSYRLGLDSPRARQRRWRL